MKVWLKYVYVIFKYLNILGENIYMINFYYENLVLFIFKKRCVLFVFWYRFVFIDYMVMLDGWGGGRVVYLVLEIKEMVFFIGK